MLITVQSGAIVSENEQAFLREVLVKAGTLALKYFNANIAVEKKGDGSPVTIADKKVEKLIRDAIGEEFPEDGILGEEETDKPGENKRKWIIDPIDGTMNFSRGIPIFSTLMALEDNGEIVLGGIYNPCVEDLYWASKGKGAFKNGKKLATSSVENLDESLVSFGAPERFVKAGLWPKLSKIIESTYKQRGYGDYLGFAYAFEGKSEANIEVDLKPWDLAPMKVMVEEAGGMFFDFDNGSSIYQGSCIMGNKPVVEKLKEILLSDD